MIRLMAFSFALLIGLLTIVPAIAEISPQAKQQAQADTSQQQEPAPDQSAPATAEEATPSTAAPETPIDPDAPAAALPAGDVRIPYGTEEKNPPAASLPLLDELVARLMQDNNLRLEIQCFAAGEVNAENKARRLSLIRCLGIREYLTNKGIAPSRTDLRALGFRSKGQPVDRVDILPYGITQ